MNKTPPAHKSTNVPYHPPRLTQNHHNAHIRNDPESKRPLTRLPFSLRFASPCGGDLSRLLLSIPAPHLPPRVRPGASPALAPCAHSARLTSACDRMSLSAL